MRASKRRYDRSAPGHTRTTRYNGSRKGAVRYARYSYSLKGAARYARQLPFGTFYHVTANLEGNRESLSD